jgi:glycine/D-amino acid oxidase-like deaminating enzyme
LIEQQVASLEPARTGVTLRWPDGSGQNFDGVVIAAGAGSARLLKPWEPLGLSLFYHPGQVLKINQTLPSRYALVRKTWSLVAREAVFFGSTTDKIASMDTPWRPEPTEAMLAKLGEEFGWRPTPSQSADSSVETLWGVRLRTGLRQPVFGSLKPLAPDSIGSDRVYLLTGFYKNGLQLADRFASWLTAEILGEDLETLAKAFHTSQYQKA